MGITYDFVLGTSCGILAMLVVFALAQLGRCYILPLVSAKEKRSIDLKGKWTTIWDEDDDEKNVKEQIYIQYHKGNEVRGVRNVFRDKDREFVLKGFYKDGLLAAYYHEKDETKRQIGVMYAFLKGNDTLTGRLIYCGQKSSKIVVAPENNWSRT